MSFTDLGLAEPILRALTDAGYASPTPIQAQAIPPVLTGRDVFGCAQTGTGKTAAFTLPLLHRLKQSNGRQGIRCLILTPTRELAAQIGDNIAAYAKHTNLRHTVIFGGVGQGRQVDALKRGVDLLVACPGRLLDLIDQGHVSLRHLEAFVLDEADRRMLDMGFVHDVRRVVKLLPKQRQTLFFSATVPTEIRELADTLLNDPVDVRVAAVSSAAETVDQSVYHVGRSKKLNLLTDLFRDTNLGQTLVFTRTKHGADKVAKRLTKAQVDAVAIHGNKSQGQRERALEAFRKGKAQVLVASDIAARGIDIDTITHVINYELPHEPETYVHRIGRTGRAGRSGTAMGFCDHDERKRLKAIQRLTKRDLTVIDTHDYVGSDLPDDVAPAPGANRNNSKNGNRGGRNGGNNANGNNGGKNNQGRRQGRPNGNNNSQRQRGQHNDGGAHRTEQRSGQRAGNRNGGRRRPASDQ